MQIKKNVLNQNVLKNLKRNSCEKLEQNENLAKKVDNKKKKNYELLVRTCFFPSTVNFILHIRPSTITPVKCLLLIPAIFCKKTKTKIGSRSGKLFGSGSATLTFFAIVCGHFVFNSWVKNWLYFHLPSFSMLVEWLFSSSSCCLVRWYFSLLSLCGLINRLCCPGTR